MASSTPSAPGDLERVRRFVNTLDVETSVEALTRPADLDRWLQEVGLVEAGHHAGKADLSRALALREALRAAMAANHGDEPMPADTVRVLNDVADRAGLSVGFTADSTWAVRPRRGGIDGALGGLLGLVVTAMRDGTWSRLKVCVNTTCQWAFYDHSRARGGKWCSMGICGNRAKQQAWRARINAD